MSGLPEALRGLLDTWSEDAENSPELVQCRVDLLSAWPAIRAEVVAEAAAREERLRAALEEMRRERVNSVRIRDKIDPLGGTEANRLTRMHAVGWIEAFNESIELVEAALADTQPEENP